MVLETACPSFARETPDEADDRGLKRPQLGWVDDRVANRAPKEQRADFAAPASSGAEFAYAEVTMTEAIIWRATEGTRLQRDALLHRAARQSFEANHCAGELGPCPL